MLARKALLHFANTIVGGLLGVIALKLVALWMGDAILGRVAYAIAILSVVQSVTTLGMRGAHEKRMGEGGNQSDKIATYFYLQLILSAVFAGIVGIGIVVWVFLLGEGFHATTLLVLVIITGYLFAQNLRQVSVNTFNGRREIARSQTITILDDFIRVAATVLAASVYAGVVRERGPLAALEGTRWDWVHAYGAELLALTYLIGTLASALVGLVYMRKVCPFGRLKRAVVENYWAFAAPVFATGVLGSLAMQVDRIMLGYFWVDATVGLYFGMDRITHVVMSLAFAVTTILIPKISRLAVEGEYERIAHVTYLSHRYIMMVLLPMVVGLIVFAGPLIRIVLAEEFLRGIPVLTVLAIWLFFSITNRPFSSAIQGLDRPELTLRVALVAVAANIVINLILIPRDIQILGITLLGLGALGAAIGTLSQSLIKYVAFRYIVRKLLPVDFGWRHVIKQVAAAVLMAASMWGLLGFVDGLARWYHIGLFAPVGLAVYLLALRVTGEFTKEDWRFFYDTIHPRRMGSYVRDELRNNRQDDQP